MNNFLINASNLHVGGGIQVATSVVGELTLDDCIPVGLVIWVSDAVDNNLRKLGYDLSVFPRYQVVNTYGLEMLFSPLRHHLKEFDGVFTIFGPLYVWRLSAKNIVGFAQPWIIYPNNEIYRSLSFPQKLKTRLKFFVQSLFFRRADRLVVELGHVKNALVARGLFDSERVEVVHNCLGSLYLQPKQWEPLSLGITKRNFSICFVGRDYPHKNTNILSGINKVLHDVYGLDVDFYVTLNPAEWSVKSDFFRSSVSNVGVLDVAQCPSFYQQMDAVIFPSLLECFSATPLEAMAMKKPLFASDRGFVRDVCGDFAWYFDPEDPGSAAKLIADYINNHAGRDDEKLSAAREHVINFSNARQRATEYLRIMQSAVAERSIL